MSVLRAPPISACRVCASHRLVSVLSLGDQYVSDFVTSEGDHPKAPLELVKCSNCGLVQLKHTIPRDSLYRHYWYRSGISETMRAALADITLKAYNIVRPLPGSIVIDIGCNDGTLLRSYPKNGLNLVGFEPAANLLEDARKGTGWIFNDFFSADVYRKKFRDNQARIITSIAMFYDVENPNEFVQDGAKCLASDGIWVVQQNYLATMLEQNGFDNIGHEHLEYYSLGTMESLLNKHGLKIFDVETNQVNGGSFRTYICHKGSYAVTPRVHQMERYENELGLASSATYEAFAERIQKIKSVTRQFVADEVRDGKTVYVYGASNRGNTILQYYELDHSLIKKAADANPEKWGRKTVGTLIPIVSKEEARRDGPDYFLVLPHHFADEIRKEESAYLRSGGRLIVPLPEFRIITN
jgi:NDP-4-keto-2,6-dideoxyhexose 3-C-methyltransferase